METLKTPHCSSCSVTDKSACSSEDNGSCCRTTHRENSEKKLLFNRCNRLEGQIRGIKGMIEKDAYCDDILNQIAAAQSALHSLSRVILENHLKGCLVSRIQNDELEVVDELLLTMQKLMK